MEERERLVPEYGRSDPRPDWEWIGVNVLAWGWLLLFLGVLYWLGRWIDA